MIVVDASATAELLLNGEQAPRIADRLFSRHVPLCAPHLILTELASVVRRLAFQGKLNEPRALEFFQDLQGIPLVFYSQEALMSRIWELRHNLTAYDATYVALAEALPAPLITSDARLGQSSGHRATIEVFAKTAGA